jgi:hypothetical protein
LSGALVEVPSKRCHGTLVPFLEFVWLASIRGARLQPSETSESADRRAAPICGARL